jgi:hypothetical protein
MRNDGTAHARLWKSEASKEGSSHKQMLERSETLHNLNRMLLPSSVCAVIPCVLCLLSSE